MKKIGVPFTVEHSNYNEDLSLKMAPRELAKHLALGKAREVATRHKTGVVVGADTIVVCDGKVIGKPVDASDARAILERLSGRGHIVVTGLALVDAKTGRSSTHTVDTKVYFRKLSKAEISAYVRTGEPLGAAGGYAIQAGGADFVERIEGDYNNVVGLPLVALSEEFEKFSRK